MADIAICGFDNIYKDKASRFIKEVREKGIPSIGILDSWKGIDRFFKDDLTLRDLTDVIILFDTFSKDYLVERGIPDHKLVLTGDFVLNELYLRYKKIKNKKSYFSDKNLDLDLDYDRPNLVFFSEPIISADNKNSSLINMPSKYKHKTVREFLEHKFSDQYNLFVRFHPLEPSSKLEKWRSLDSMSLLDSIILADEIVGLSATPVHYASKLGLKIYNLENDLQKWKSSESNIPEDLWRFIKSEYKTSKKMNPAAFNNIDLSLSRLVQSILGKA